MEQTHSPISIRRSRRGTRIRLSGNIDLAMARELHQAARAVVEDPNGGEVLCRRLGHLSGAALQVVAALAADLRARGGTLRSAGAPPAIQPLLEMAGLALITPDSAGARKD